MSCPSFSTYFFMIKIQKLFFCKKEIELGSWSPHERLMTDPVRSHDRTECSISFLQGNEVDIIQ